MRLASAYPNSAISTVAMIAIAVVAAGSLAFWLVMVFVADRRTRGLSERRAQEPAATVAGPALSGPDETAEDESSEAGRGDGVRRQTAA